MFKQIGYISLKVHSKRCFYRQPKFHRWVKLCICTSICNIRTSKNWKNYNSESAQCSYTGSGVFCSKLTIFWVGESLLGIAFRSLNIWPWQGWWGHESIRSSSSTFSKVPAQTGHLRCKGIGCASPQFRCPISPNFLIFCSCQSKEIFIPWPRDEGKGAYSHSILQDQVHGSLWAFPEWFRNY